MCSGIIVFIGDIVGRVVGVSIYNIMRRYVCTYVYIHHGGEVGVYIGNIMSKSVGVYI
jgi:hypothetical protein